MSETSKIPYPGSLQEIVGSLLFASETPLTAGDIRSIVKAMEPEEENNETAEVYRTCTSREIESALRGLEKALEVAKCGFSLVCTAGAYRLQTVPQCGRYVRSMLKMDRPNRLGRASLETLAIIAYRQPVTKSEIEEIRGVDVSGNVKTLMDLGLIRLVGKSELPGHPFLYGTTPLFLEHFGLASLQELNDLDPTLQRSNPRLKAASYKKPKKDDQPDLPSAEEISETPQAPQPPQEALESKDGEDETPEEKDIIQSGAENAEDGDDIFIDDTPDEFDDDDDDEYDPDEDAGDETDDEEDGE